MKFTKSDQRDLRDLPLPTWLVDKLAHPPSVGAGIHPWLFSTACGLKPWRDDPEIFRLLTAAAAECGRPVPQTEIADAVKNAYSDWSPDDSPKVSKGLRTMLAAAGLAPEPRGWPKPDFGLIAKVAYSGAGLADLWEASPLRLHGGHHAEHWLDALFPGDPLLCLGGEHPSDFATMRRKEWDKIGVRGGTFIVPSEMSAEMGTRQDGQPSKRCLTNTGPRQFLVIEFDFVAEKDGEPMPAAPLLAELTAERNPRTSVDMCAAILLHMAAQGAPLAIAVHSAGKSIHGWFQVDGASDDQLRPFFARARLLGADTATWTPCQLVRLPEGTRGVGSRQRVFYANPAFLRAPEALDAAQQPRGPSLSFLAAMREHPETIPF